MPISTLPDVLNSIPAGAVISVLVYVLISILTDAPSGPRNAGRLRLSAGDGP